MASEWLEGAEGVAGAPACLAKWRRAAAKLLEELEEFDPAAAAAAAAAAELEEPEAEGEQMALQLLPVAIPLLPLWCRCCWFPDGGEIPAMIAFGY